MLAGRAVRLELRVLKRTEVSLTRVRTTFGVAAHVYIKTKVLRVVRFLFTQMPLASEESSVTLFLQRSRQSDFLQWHIAVQLRRYKLSSSLAREKVCRLDASWILSGQQTIPSRRTNRVGCIAVGKSHSSRREPIDIGRLVKTVGIIRPDVHIPQIVDQKDNHVRRISGVLRNRSGKQSRRPHQAK